MKDFFHIPKLSHLSAKTKLSLQLYHWRKVDSTMITPLGKPLAQSSVAIVSTAGLVVKGQPPFDTRAGGDWTMREIPAEVKATELEEHHRSQTFDHSGVQQFPFSVLPIPHLNRLEQEHFIGRANHRHFSLMGSITAPGRFLKYTVPQIIECVRADKVDAVFLIPV